MTDIKDGYLTISEDVTLHYVEGGQPAGSAPLVLFYHGFPSFWYSFHLQVEALGDHFHVAAVDGLGANESSKPTDLALYKVENLAAQLDQLARYLVGDETFYLVGHDWGGALSWAYAQNYPERLKKLVVFNAPPVNQLLKLLQNNEVQRERSSYMYDMREGKIHHVMTRDNNKQVCDGVAVGLRKLPHYSEEMEQAFRKGLSTPGAVDAGINWYRANVPPVDEIGADDYWPSETASTDVPALLVWGNDDLTFVDSFIDDLPAYASNLEVFRVPDVGHSPMYERPHEVNERLLAFLVP